MESDKILITINPLRDNTKSILSVASENVQVTVSPIYIVISLSQLGLLAKTGE